MVVHCFFIHCYAVSMSSHHVRVGDVGRVGAQDRLTRLDPHMVVGYHARLGEGS